MNIQIIKLCSNAFYSIYVHEYSDNKIVFKCILQYIRTLQKIVRYEITSNNFSKCMHIAF